MRVISLIIFIGIVIFLTYDDKNHLLNINYKQCQKFIKKNLDNYKKLNHYKELDNYSSKLSIDNEINNTNINFLPNNVHNISNITNKSLSEQEQINNIYNFLLADLAIARDQPLVAKNKLIEILQNTRDPNIAEILTEFAIQIDDLKLTEFASKEWAELDHNNCYAQLVSSLILLENEPILVEKFIEQAIKINPEDIDLKLANLLSQLYEDKKLLFEQRLISIVEREPKNSIKQLCLAQVAVQTNNMELATKSINIALKHQPNLTNAILLQAKLIKHNTHSDRLALNYLSNQVKKHPNNLELIIFYANALFDNDQNLEALKVLQPLLSNNKNLNAFVEANLLCAEIYMQKSTINLKKAKHYLNKLINNDLLANGKVYFMLGEIAEQQLDHQQAIKFYTLIEEPPYQVIGFLRSALLLADNQQYAQAIELLKQAEVNNVLEKKQLLLLQVEFAIELKDLTQALEAVQQGLSIIPNDVDFLYAASLVYTLGNQFNLAETSLNKIIQLQPENHVALNALGFILTMIPNRQKEALHYLQVALNLSPNNPIYMDNLGMLYYSMGKINDSIKILTNAYNIKSDPKIAIHLGKLLWEIGKHKEATSILKKAWRINPHDLELLEVLNQNKIFFMNNN